ncbi:MAG: hypothetical protein EA384_02700 [Spirochaetaceae bacterium]|nr:MAG: hypothetical protein EA384_02700 [Spirochaetaceae bacterium]
MKLLTVAILCIITGNGAFAQSPDLAQIPDLVETWRQIVAFYPRHEAGDGEMRTRELIRQRLALLGVTTVERGFADFDGAHSFSRVIEATFPGMRRDRLVIAVPLNHQYGAERDRDGAIGLAAALQLAAVLAGNPPPVTVSLLFLGAEREPLPGYPLGSRLYVAGLVADRPTAVLYLDLQRPGDPLVLDTAARAAVAPAWLLQTLGAALDATGVDFDAQPIRSQIRRIGLARDPAIAPFLQADTAAIGIRSESRPGERPAELTLQPVEALLDGLERLIAGFTDGIPTGWDRHYVFFQFGNRIYVLGEQLYLMIFLGLIAAVLFYALAFRHRAERYARTMLRNIWSVPAVYLLLFVLLLAATAAIERFLDLRSYPGLWRHQPLLFFCVKLSMTVFLFSLSMLPLRRTLLASTSSFYSASALVVLFVGIATLAVVHISFSYYFLWAFLWAFLFAVVPKRALKVVCLAVAPLPLLYGAWFVYTSGEYSTGRILLLSPIGGNLLFALLMLPFLLMLLRLDFLVRHPRLGRRSFVLQLTASVAALCTAGLGLAIVQYQPYGEHAPQPITLRETISLIDNSRRLDVRSNGKPLQSVPLRIGERTVIWSGSPLELPFDDQRPPLTIERRSSAFLERNRLQYTVSSATELYTVEVEILSTDSLLLYDANLPVSMGAGGQQATVFVGVLPPDPFTIDVTVPDLVRGNLLLRATSRRLSEDVVVTRPDLRIEATELLIRAQDDL